MKKKVVAVILSFVLLLMSACTPSCFINSSVAEGNTTLLYAIPTVSNSYEQTLNTFTFNYCYPAQLLNHSPSVTDYKEDPNGLTWCIFVFEHSVVQLTGKDSQGNWKCATWSDVEPSDMLFICYCLCKAFGPVYKDNADFAICFYSDSGENSYITNKAAADSFIAMIDDEYGENDNSEMIGKGENDPILSLFPAISWGMTKAEMINKYGSDLIMDISDEEHPVCVSMVKIYDEDVMIMFRYANEKLDSITAIYSVEKTALYLADMMKDYGKPVRTYSLYSFADELKEFSDGDVAIWRTDNSNITIDLREAGSVTYRPL